MHSIKTVLFAALTCLMVSTAAAAPKDPNIGFGVVPYPNGNPVDLSSRVTMSSTRYDTHVAYRVAVFNGTTNTLNRVFLRGDTSVIGAAVNTSVVDPAIYPESGTVGACTQPGGLTSIRCDIGPGGSLAANTGASFWVVVKSPLAGTTLNFTATLGGDEGNGGGNGCCDATKVIATELIDPVLASTDPAAAFKNEVQSFVKTGGGTFFTGATGVATVDDPWATTVQVPTVATGLLGLPFTTAAIAESLLAPSCSAVNKKCHQSALTIPGTFSNLLITLQQHPSIIKNGSRIENWRIAYSHDPAITAPVTLLRCDATNPPVGPTASVPCIQACQEYSSKSIPAVPRSMWGIFECKINAVDNGSYSNE